jgi:hypothetical protein
MPAGGAPTLGFPVKTYDGVTFDGALRDITIEMLNVLETMLAECDLETKNDVLKTDEVTVHYSQSALEVAYGVLIASGCYVQSQVGDELLVYKPSPPNYMSAEDIVRLVRFVVDENAIPGNSKTIPDSFQSSIESTIDAYLDVSVRFGFTRDSLRSINAFQDTSFLMDELFLRKNHNGVSYYAVIKPFFPKLQRIMSERWFVASILSHEHICQIMTNPRQTTHDVVGKTFSIFEVKNVDGLRGVFSTKNTPKGSLLAVYRGNVIDYVESVIKRLDAEKTTLYSDYLFPADPFSMTVTDALEPNGALNVSEDNIAAMINEPFFGGQANVRFVPHERIHGVVMVQATKDISAGDALLGHYGDNYPRNPNIYVKGVGEDHEGNYGSTQASLAALWEKKTQWKTFSHGGVQISWKPFMWHATVRTTHGYFKITRRIPVVSLETFESLPNMSDVFGEGEGGLFDRVQWSEPCLAEPGFLMLLVFQNYYVNMLVQFRGMDRTSAMGRFKEKCYERMDNLASLSRDKKGRPGVVPVKTFINDVKTRSVDTDWGWFWRNVDVLNNPIPTDTSLPNQKRPITVVVGGYEQ